MLNISVIASSSQGNCYTVSDGTTTLMLECGLSMNEIKKGTGYSLSGIHACLVTHEHQDHAKAAEGLAKIGIPVYTSRGTAQALGLQSGTTRLTHGQKQTLGTFAVLPFNTRHDAAEPLGFLLHSGQTGERLLFITDSFYVAHRFPPVEYIMVECNHISEYLREGKNPQQVARLTRSHMSLATCIRFLQAQPKQKLKRIYLLHISRDNGDPARMQREVQRATGKEVIIARP